MKPDTAKPDTASRSADLNARLNLILKKITAADFLQARGLSKEIPFHIFDYPAEDELRVREHVDFVLQQIPKRRPEIKFKHVDLFDFVLEYLQARKLLDKALDMQRKKGNAALLKALRGPLHEEKIAQRFNEAVQPGDLDIVLVSRVGSAYPLLRAHTLLSNLQQYMGNTALVMFYPGRYDGTTLRLFNKTGLAGDEDRVPPYYRAFRLVD